jgi:predicted Zn-dependent protease
MALVMQDYRRRFELLADRPVDPKDAAAAVAESPTDPVLRCTYALALLRSGRLGEALAALQEIDIMPERLPPADQAVVIAVLTANGKDERAAALRGALDAKNLRKSERALAFGS